MTLLGFTHTGHHGHHGPGHSLDAHHGEHTDVGHGLDAHHGGHLHAGQGHGAHGHTPLAHSYGTHGLQIGNHDSHDPHDHAPAGNGGLGYLLLGLLSPITLFSLALGAGATGTILRSFGLSTAAAALPSAFGAWFFYAAILRPLRNFVFGFASRPAQSLEGALLQQAEVVTSFNERGEGLVRLTVDGQSVDVLARLQDAGPGVRVRRGQRVLVEDVDTHRNMVRVSRL
jgi:hypothetical protein